MREGRYRCPDCRREELDFEDDGIAFCLYCEAHVLPELGEETYERDDD